MKYLNDYTEEAQTALFDECGAFFAFSMNQLEEAAKKHNIEKNERGKYPITGVGAGLYVKNENIDKLIDGLDEIGERGRMQDLADHGVERVIIRELNNHEAYYTGDIESTWDALQAYPICKWQVEKMFRNKKFQLSSKIDGKTV